MDYNVIADIKALAIDMINEAGSGHPGIVLGAAPILYTLYANHLNVNPNDENWINRDRFILSAGHGSALLYATLYMAGFNLTLDDLKQFRKLNSITPGHPEYEVTPGVDMTTGPLGQGFASAVGMAISEKIMHEQTKINNYESLINHKVYVLCSDGDLMEGLSYEAASLAGTLNLNNLIVLYDSNNICLDGNTNMAFNENIVDRFKSMNWNTIVVKNGCSIRTIDRAIKKAKNANKPTLIEIKTILGNGSMLANTNKVHGKPLSRDDVFKIKDKLFIPQQQFFDNQELRNYMKNKIRIRSEKKYKEWNIKYNEFNNKQLDSDGLKYIFKKEEKTNILDHDFSINENEQLRLINNKIMNEISNLFYNFRGGSADVASATDTYLKGGQDFNKNNYLGKNIWFGVREHAMGAILNGMALDNHRVFGSTFLSFSDYLKPAIRLAAIMKLPVTYIFTHDSISIGQDGPTHQPIEQLAMLRSIPNVNVYRPCDANELIGCWNEILNTKTSPSALIISKDELPILNVSKKEEISKGAYIIESEHNKLDGIIIATGSDVHIALNVARDLYIEQGIELRIVSIPCMELFLKQSGEYKNMILPKDYKKFVIESGTKFGWSQFVDNDDHLFTIEQFGKSGTKEEVLNYFKINCDIIKQRIERLIK